MIQRRDGSIPYTTVASLQKAFRKALRVCNDSGMERQYKAGLKSRRFTASFLEAIFPHTPGVMSSAGNQIKFLVFPENESLPPIDPAYTARVTELSNQREMDRDAVDIESDLWSDDAPIEKIVTSVNAQHSNVDGQSPFDQIRHVDHQGEWWDARELQGILGYQASWQNFENAIEKAKLSLKASDGAEVDHFNDVIKMIPTGKGANRPVNTYRLSRHACHLIAQNGDPSKPQIAAAQRYFSVQTRRAELMDAGLSPIERTAHIDALVSGQQQLTAAVEGIEDDTKMALSKIDRIMAELVSLKTELQEKTPENKRRQFPLSVQKRVGRLFYEYTRGGGCLGNRQIQVIDANGDKISPMQFDHWDGNESRNVYDNCVPMSLELHKRKTAGKLTADERKRIDGFIDWMRMIEEDYSELQLGLL